MQLATGTARGASCITCCTSETFTHYSLCRQGFIFHASVHFLGKRQPMPWRSNHNPTTFPTIFHLTSTFRVSLHHGPTYLNNQKLLHIPILYDASNLATEHNTVYLSQMCRESMIRVPGKSERRQMTFKSETRYTLRWVPFGHFFKAKTNATHWSSGGV